MATCKQFKCPYMEICSSWKIISSDRTNFDMLKCPYMEICSFWKIIGLQTVQTLIWVLSKKPAGREVVFTQGYGKNLANWSRIGPKFGWYWKVNQKSGRSTNVPFHSTFRTCWASTSTRKCISLTKLVTFSQYIRETLFSCRCFLIFGNKLLNFNFC